LLKGTILTACFAISHYIQTMMTLSRLLLISMSTGLVGYRAGENLSGWTGNISYFKNYEGKALRLPKKKGGLVPFIYSLPPTVSRA